MSDRQNKSEPSPFDLRLTQPPPPDGLSLGEMLTALEGNMERLAHAFDAIPSAAWTNPLGDAERKRLADEWPADFTDKTPSTLLEILGFLRDEEAYVFGRRAMRLIQEEAPEFEHLTYALAAMHRDFHAETPPLHFSELVKNRHTWLAFVRGEGPKSDDDPLAMRTGKLPEEEDGGEINLVDIAAAAMRRDAAVHQLILRLKQEAA